MSRMLNLVDQLRSRAQKLQTLGLHHDAEQTYRHLSTFRELPPAVAEETQAQLGELELERQAYARARRHFACALLHHPENARYHHGMALALDLDEASDATAARRHYEQALSAAPDDAEILCDYGLWCVNAGEEETGLAALRRAAERALDRPEILGKVVEGFCAAGQAAEARHLLEVARFPNRGRLEFERLWSDFEFQQLQEQQGSHVAANPLLPCRPRSAVLPFARPEAEGAGGTGERRVQIDRPAGKAPAHRPRRHRRTGRKHA